MSAVTREWRAVARAELTIARKLGVGGDAWNVTRASGDGVSAAVTSAPVGVWAGYVAEEDTTTLVNAAPAATVGAKHWYAVGDTAIVLPTPPALPATLAIGDVIVSQDSAALRFAVAAQDRVVGYARYLLEPLP
jgi:hypothetical protein